MLLLVNSQLVLDLAPVDIAVDIIGPMGTYSPDPINLNLRPIDIGVYIPGPRVNPYAPVAPPAPFDPLPGPIVQAYVGGVLSTLLIEANYQRAKSDTGSASVTMAYGDPASSAAPGDDLIVYLNGSPRQMAVVEQVEVVVQTEGEEAAQTVTASGRGVVCEWEWAVILPDIGAEEPAELGAPWPENRLFNWTGSSSINDSGWTGAVETAAHYGGGSIGTNAQRFVRPEGWPWNQAAWIWDRSSAEAVRVGEVFFRRTFGVSGAQMVKVFAAADDQFELYLDGVPILSHEGYYTGKMEQTDAFEIGSHFHLLSARCLNRVGRAGFLMAMCPVEDDSTLGRAIMQSDASWKCLGYPETVPGTTIPRVLQILLDEAQARGVLPGWSLSVGAGPDGGTWPVLTDFALPVGMTYLDALNQMAGEYIDYTFSPYGRVLQVYAIGTMPGGSGTIVPTEISRSIEG